MGLLGGATVFCVVVRWCYSVLDGCYSAMWLLCAARVFWIVARKLGVVVSVLLHGCFDVARMF